MKIAAYAAVVSDAGFALFYPRGCALCSESVESIADGATCHACWQKTRIFNGRETFCNKCGRLLENSLSKTSEHIFCHRCDSDFYDLARAVGIYENALRVAVLELKEKSFISSRLQHLFYAAFLSSPFSSATKIVPVPLHKKRFRERGFNQTEVLARVLSQKLKLPVLEKCLTRETYTQKHRANMDEQARRESVEKAFAIKQPRLIKNETILLVDDVFTTGATVSLCAKVLKEAGADKVFILTIARGR